MTNTRKRLLASTGAVLYLALLFWAVGYDFNERGSTAVLFVFLAGVFVALAASYPFQDDLNG